MSQRTLNHTVRHGVSAALVFAPLAFGTVEFWSLALVEILILALGAVTLGWHLCSRMPRIEIPKVRKMGAGATRTLSLAVLMGLFLAYTWLQMVPLPAPWLQKISPHTWKLQHSAMDPLSSGSSFLPLLGTTTFTDTTLETAEAAAARTPVTVNLHATCVEWFKTITYVVFFWLIIVHFHRGRHFRRMASFLIFLGAAIAILALIQRFSGADKIFWLRETAQNRFMAPFVNENHYAGYMEMTICLGLGYFLFRMEQNSASSGNGKGGWKQRLISIKSPINGLIFFSVVVMAVSVIFSLSRGGILTLFLSFLNITYLLLLRQIIAKRKASVLIRRRSLLVHILTACWLILLFVAWLGAEPVVEEMLTLRNVSHQIKLQVMRDSLEVIRDYPLVGTGMGTFPYIYPTYQSFTSDMFFTHTENDYLQLLSEGGLTGFALMTGIIGLVAMGMMRALLAPGSDAHSRRPDNSTLIMGCFAALLSILVHSFFDFNLHIPANALLFTTILAMGHGLSTLSSREGRSR